MGVGAVMFDWTSGSLRVTVNRGKALCVSRLTQSIGEKGGGKVALCSARFGG